MYHDCEFSKAEVIASVATLPRRRPELLQRVQQFMYEILSIFADGIDAEVGDEMLLEAIIQCCVHTRCEAAKPMIIRMYGKYKIPNILIPGGANACPPDDIGGIYQYNHLVKLIHEKPDSPEIQEFYEWMGCKWNPSFFPLGEASDAVDGLND